MSRTIATSGGLLLCVTGALLAVGFLPPVLFAQQSLPGGANLFAPSREVGKELDEKEGTKDSVAFFSTT